MADKSGGAHPGFVQDAHHRIFLFPPRAERGNRSLLGDQVD